MRKIAVLVALCMLCSGGLALAEFKDDDVSGEWKNMTDREKKFYLSGVTNALTVMCGKDATSPETYNSCRNKWSRRSDLPKSFLDLFEQAYTSGRYSDIPSDMLVHIWGTTTKGEQAAKLEAAQKFAKERRKVYGGKHE